MSLRDEFGAWDPRNQRPELWNLYNTRHLPGQHVRVFPLSNWTELDVWRYIEREGLDLPELYYAHEREVFERDGMLLTPHPALARKDRSRSSGALVQVPHRGRRELHRGRRVGRRDHRRRHRRGRRDPHHRARSDARRRPGQRGRHGRPQEGGLLLVTATASAALRPPTLRLPDSRQTSLLRFATAGSVDDGKSTLVGRLLHDTKSILADAYEAVERVTRERGGEGVDLALLTDGLRAEREQGITIDVAYRYFSTPRRTFILADCPGHVQYTRNTVTGASTADALVVLVDVRTGVVEQTRRHLAVAALLRVPHVIVAVNKIDLLGWERAPYDAIAADAAEHGSRLGIEVSVVPVSALLGDNVAARSRAHALVHGAHRPRAPRDAALGRRARRRLDRSTRRRCRDAAGAFPCSTCSAHRARRSADEYREYRGYAGQVSQGVIRVGDEVVVQPSGRRTTIAGIDTADGPLAAARAGQSIAVRLADDVDVARGDLLSSAPDAARAVKNFDAHVAWLSDRPLRVRDRVLVQHGTALVQAMVMGISGVLDISLPGGTLDSSIVPGDRPGSQRHRRGLSSARLAARHRGLQHPPPHGSVRAGRPAGWRHPRRGNRARRHARHGPGRVPEHLMSAASCERVIL